MSELTTKQRLFVEAYLANPNATEAARVAGYKGNDVTLGAVGAENLKKPLIAQMVKARVDKAILTADEVLQGVTTIAQDGKARNGDRLKAYELMAKYHKLLTDKTEHSGEVKVEIIVTE